ncbi:hypothetical protein G9A89_004153 [Geosiphon pyriformis]|nr:hypothetical protein G9A89_004153 [Geosiphon pyriformis]
MFIGHGLGGISWALERYVIIVEKEWPDIDLSKTYHQVVTFGAPRVANKEFSISLNQVIQHYRFTHGNDYVPHFPSTSMGWNHFGIEIWIEPLNGCDCPEDNQSMYWDCNHSMLSTAGTRQSWIAGIYSN